MIFLASAKYLNKLPLQIGLTALISLAGLFSAKPASAQRTNCIPLLGLCSERFIGGFSSVNNYQWITKIDPPSYVDSYIVPAINQWNGRSTKVQLTRITSGNYNVEIQVRFGSDDPRRTGVMLPRCLFGENKNICFVLPWSSALVIGYEDVMRRNGYGTAQRISVFTHEIGHSLSLAHAFNDIGDGPPAVMKVGTQAIGVQEYDVINLRQKWGN